MQKPVDGCTRREFLAASSSLALGAFAGDGQPAAPTNLRVQDKAVLSESDFRYLGYYRIKIDGEFSLGQALSHRYVNGQFRLLALTHRPADWSVNYGLLEIVPPALNGEVNGSVGSWGDIWGGKKNDANGQWHGLFWDDQKEALWSTGAIDYPNDTQSVSPYAMALTTLGNSGTVASVRGLWGLNGLGARRIYGGFTRVPDWFRAAYGVGPLAVGFGGYTSRMAQGLIPSMGPCLYAMDDPSTLADNTVLPTNRFKVLMDYSSGTQGGAWYPGKTKPDSFDRGVRLSPVDNTYDSWKSPAPDGYNRWTWGDSCYQTGIWIDQPTKHGFIVMPTVHLGRTWYQSSTLNYMGKTAEIHVFNPADLGEVATGSRAPWAVKPTSMWKPVQFPTTGQGQGNGPALTGATYDPLTQRLYARWGYFEGVWPNPSDRIFVWEVG